MKAFKTCVFFKQHEIGKTCLNYLNCDLWKFQCKKLLEFILTVSKWLKSYRDVIGILTVDTSGPGTVCRTFRNDPAPPEPSPISDIPIPCESKPDHAECEQKELFHIFFFFNLFQQYFQPIMWFECRWLLIGLETDLSKTWLQIPHGKKVLIIIIKVKIELDYSLPVCKSLRVITIVYSFLTLSKIKP